MKHIKRPINTNNLINANPEFEVYEIPDTGKSAILETNSLESWILENEEVETKLDQLQKDVTTVKCPQYNFFNLPGRVANVCLETTFACNLACTYCFVRNYSADEIKGSRMSFETAVQFLNKHCGNPPGKPQPISVSFFGGEPTLNMTIIYQVVHYCLINYRNPQFHMTTNGLRLNDQMNDHLDIPDESLGDMTIAEWVDRHNFSMIVSLDGPAKAHDEYRIFHNNTGSHRGVIAGIEHLAAAARNTARRNTLRATFTSAIVDSEFSLTDRLRHLNEYMWKGCAAHVSVEPVALSEGSCISGEEDMAILTENMEGLRTQYMGAADWFIQTVKEGKNVPSWHQIELFMRRIYNVQHAVSECGAGKGYLTCMHDGTVAACHRTHNAKIGSLKKGIDEQARAKWIENRFYGRKDCPDCPIRYICGGGCRECSVGEYGDITKPVVFECEIKRIWAQCAYKIIDALDPAEMAKICPQRK